MKVQMQRIQTVFNNLPTCKSIDFNLWALCVSIHSLEANASLWQQEVNFKIKALVMVLYFETFTVQTNRKQNDSKTRQYRFRLKNFRGFD